MIWPRSYIDELYSLLPANIVARFDRAKLTPSLSSPEERKAAQNLWQNHWRRGTSGQGTWNNGIETRAPSSSASSSPFREEESSQGGNNPAVLRGC